MLNKSMSFQRYHSRAHLVLPNGPFKTSCINFLSHVDEENAPLKNNNNNFPKSLDRRMTTVTL
jgi:hypothetical protein